MSHIKLYAFPLSPPCRGVHLVADMINLKVDYVTCNPMAGDTRTPEFLAVGTSATTRLAPLFYYIGCQIGVVKKNASLVKLGQNFMWLLVATL